MQYLDLVYSEMMHYGVMELTQELIEYRILILKRMEDIRLFLMMLTLYQVITG